LQISQAWAQNDLPKIDKIYYKTSVVQMLIGFILFIGLVINKPLITLLLHKPEYGTYFNVLIVVGIGFLVDITGGLNGYIMNISKYYKLTTYLIGLAAITCAVTNWLLIPRLGIIGAALAYTITTFVLNFAYWLFLKVKFNLQPFGKAHVLILLVSLITLAIGWYLPAIGNVWVDFIIRSALVTVVYVLLSYFLNISEDINLLINKALRIGNAE
jgi:O-antigen/teichoic acid export membrane protein